VPCFGIEQDYPKHLLEIIVVDDHSEDATAVVAGDFAYRNVRCIKLAEVAAANGVTNSFKKAAIAAGINESKGTLIVTTDADCIAPARYFYNR
jgi:cellulose synthase/poly-beta-1,6-N-acetylglucosamine synthase-like glycosyltransferase